MPILRFLYELDSQGQIRESDKPRRAAIDIPLAVINTFSLVWLNCIVNHVRVQDANEIVRLPFRPAIKTVSYCVRNEAFCLESVYLPFFRREVCTGNVCAGSVSRAGYAGYVIGNNVYY